MENSKTANFLHIADLISGYINETLNDDQLNELFIWVAASAANRSLFDEVVNEKKMDAAYRDFNAFDTASALITIKSKLIPNSVPIKKRDNRWAFALAASILLCLFAGLYLFYQHSQPTGVAKINGPDIAPGRNQATLTLANGQKIILTKGLSGTLAQQGNTLIQVNLGQAIAYHAHSADGRGSKIEYNTLSTKNSEQSPYPLILADGTKVWLNAASSVTFPTAFTGKNRMVTVTGEAYFEVVHNPKHPFMVNVKGQTITDIGTSFNINAYNDEAVVKTSLVEGKISITKNGQMKTLAPGEQSQVDATGTIAVVGNADIEEALAWKNGLFKFNHTDIKAVMRQFSRWYDLKVEYEGEIPNNAISGKLYRNVKASDALQILNYLKIHLRMENTHGEKKIIITP